MSAAKVPTDRHHTGEADSEHALTVCLLGSLEETCEKIASLSQSPKQASSGAGGSGNAGLGQR